MFATYLSTSLRKISGSLAAFTWQRGTVCIYSTDWPQKVAHAPVVQAATGCEVLRVEISVVCLAFLPPGYVSISVRPRNRSSQDVKSDQRNEQRLRIVIRP